MSSPAQRFVRLVLSHIRFRQEEAAKWQAYRWAADAILSSVPASFSEISLCDLGASAVKK